MKSDFREGSKCDLPRKRKQRGTTQGLERDDQMERARGRQGKQEIQRDN